MQTTHEQSKGRKLMRAGSLGVDAKAPGLITPSEALVRALVQRDPAARSLSIRLRRTLGPVSGSSGIIGWRWCVRKPALQCPCCRVAANKIFGSGDRVGRDVRVRGLVLPRCHGIEAYGNPRHCFFAVQSSHRRR